MTISDILNPLHCVATYRSSEDAAHSPGESVRGKGGMHEALSRGGLIGRCRLIQCTAPMTCTLNILRGHTVDNDAWGMVSHKQTTATI